MNSLTLFPFLAFHIAQLDSHTLNHIIWNGSILLPFLFTFLHFSSVFSLMFNVKNILTVLHMHCFFPYIDQINKFKCRPLYILHWNENDSLDGIIFMSYASWIKYFFVQVFEFINGLKFQAIKLWRKKEG